MNRLGIFFFIAVFATVAALVTPTSAFADKNDAHHSLSLGTWWGSMSENYLGATSSTTLPPALGAELRIGQYFGPIFFDWSPTLFTAINLSGADRSGESSYGSVFVLNGGFSFMRLKPAIPLEVYLGVESGGIHFNNGIQVSYSGTTLKFGADLPLFDFTNSNRFGFTFQYRVTYVGSDDVGRLPPGASVRLHLYYAGLLLHFGSQAK